MNANHIRVHPRSFAAQPRPQPQPRLTERSIMQTLLHPHQFRRPDDLTAAEKRTLFAACVKFVEIETFTFCNRKCWFCPNATMPERQDRAGNRYMDEGLYLRILADLKSVNYAGQIQFGRYNEPLADRIILERIRQARQHCRKAWLYTHTNGDYLTRAYLDELAAAGLSAIALQTYLGNDDRWDEARMELRQLRQLERLGVGIEETLCCVENVRHLHLTNYPGLELTIDARNFDTIGTDRGGLVDVNVPSTPRTAPCLVPFSNVYIDWTGNTVPCCNIRSDRPEHASYVVSRLQDGFSIFDAYAALHAWRRELLRFGPKKAPCDTCNYEVGSVSPEAAGQLEGVYERFVAANERG